MSTIKDNILSATSVPFDTDISASETSVPPHCQFPSVLCTEIRRKQTGKGRGGRRGDIEGRQICADTNGLQVFFFFKEKKEKIDGVGDMDPLPHAVIMFYGRRSQAL